LRRPGPITDEAKVGQHPERGTSAETVSHPSAVLRPGATCWRVVRASRLSLIIDAADYFAIARAAMFEARHTIFLIGRDFNLRIEFAPGTHDGTPERLRPS
jgi:hypothetical protein